MYVSEHHEGLAKGGLFHGTYGSETVFEAIAIEDIPPGAPATVDLKLGLVSRTRGPDGEPLA